LFVVLNYGGGCSNGADVVWLLMLPSSHRSHRSYILDALRASEDAGGGTSIDEQQQADTRHTLLVVLRRCMAEGFNEREAETLIGFCVTCESSSLLVYFLTFLRDLCIASTRHPHDTTHPGRHVQLALCANGPPLFLYGILQRADEKVRLAALWLIVFFSSDTPCMQASGRDRMRLRQVGCSSLVELLHRDTLNEGATEALLALATDPVLLDVQVDDGGETVVISMPGQHMSAPVSSPPHGAGLDAEAAVQEVRSEESASGRGGDARILVDGCGCGTDTSSSTTNCR